MQVLQYIPYLNSTLCSYCASPDVAAFAGVATGVSDFVFVLLFPLCEPSDNAKNQSLSARNTSGQIGVSYSSQFHKWRAYVGDNRKYISLGYYKTKEEAIAARLAGEKKYYGEFAPSLN